MNYSNVMAKVKKAQQPGVGQQQQQQQLFSLDLVNIQPLDRQNLHYLVDFLLNHVVTTKMDNNKNNNSSSTFATPTSFERGLLALKIEHCILIPDKAIPILRRLIILLAPQPTTSITSKPPD
jgi:hypothetical protein